MTYKELKNSKAGWWIGAALAVIFWSVFWVLDFQR